MITKFTIKNFKKFGHKELLFNKGINIIIWKNEAGKSTILSALLAALFADVNTKAGSFFSESLPWKSSSKDIYFELNFLTAAAQYRLTRDFKAQEQAIKNITTQENITDYKTIQATLETQLHIPSKQIFEATSFVRQAELTNIQFSQDIRSALQRISSISPEGVKLEVNLKELEKELQQLVLGLDRPSKTPGSIKATQEELSLITTNLSEKKLLWEKFVVAKSSSVETEIQITEIDNQIKIVEEAISNYSKFEQANKRLKLIEDQLLTTTNTLNAISLENLTLKQAMSQLKSMVKFSDSQTNQAAEQLVRLKQIIQSYSENISEQQKLLRSSSSTVSYMEVSKQANQLRYIYVGISLIIIAIILEGLEIFTKISSLGQISLPIIIIGIIVTTLSLILRSSNNSKAKNVSKINDDLVTKQIASYRARIAEAENEQLIIYKQYGVKDYNDFFTTKAKYNTLVEEEARLNNTIKGYLNGKTYAEVEAQQVKLLTEKKEIEVIELTPEVRASQFSPNDYLRKRRELDMLLVERKRKERDNNVNTIRAEDNPVTIEEINNLEEKFTLLETRLKKLSLRKIVLDETLRLLKLAIAKTSSTATKVISTEVEKYLPKLTLGRYKDIQLTDKYELKVFASLADAWIHPLGQLSLGTVDQIYFLTRMALAKTILNRPLDYLFLDDPFVTYDEERLLQTKEILTDIAQVTQVFIFTHNEQYANWGNTLRL